MSPRDAASATPTTSSPASRAAATLGELSRRPTTTSTPESLRFRAWAWPWEPKPMIATVLPSRRVRSASSSEYRGGRPLSSPRLRGSPPAPEARRRREENMRVRFAGCLLAAMLLSACGGAGNDKTSAAPGPQRLDVTARDFALKINGSPALRPGRVTITARNSGKQPHGMVLVKLNDGVDTPALVSALTTQPDRVGNLLTYVGGTTTLPKQASWEATTTFDPGSYAMLDVGTSNAGRLNFTRRGEVQGFTVSGDKVATPPEPVSAKVSLFDYGIIMPKVIPQAGRIQVENTGNDDHQLVFLP